jgi:hypothetical protein
VNLPRNHHHQKLVFMGEQKIVVMKGLAWRRKILITQEDLAELALLREAKRQADLALREKREWFLQRLQAGAQVEPGIRTVQLKQSGLRLAVH